MTDFILDRRVKDRFDLFMEDILSSEKENIHAIAITGSALTSDWDPRRSDINSVLVMNAMGLRQIEKLAPMGKKYGKKGIASPLIMTPAHIQKSLDVFPIEFLTIKRIHLGVFGKDIFKDIEIRLSDLRTQCEREVKVKLIGLRQSYISACGDRKRISEKFIHSFSGYIPLFAAIITLLGGKPPIVNNDVLGELEKITGIGMDMFRRVSQGKREGRHWPMEQLNQIFEDYCETLEKLGDIVDEWQQN
jgi:hypothetical protein